MTDWKSLESAVNLEPKLEMAFLSLDFDEASYEMKDLETALVFVFVNSEKDLATLEKIKIAFKREFNISHRFVVVKQIRSGLIENKIEKMGFNDIIELVVNFRTLRQKIDTWLGRLQGATAPVLATPSPVKEDPVAVAKDGFIWEKSVDNFDDFWIIREEKSKKIINRFSIKAFGPGPYVGRWIEIAKNTWTFELKEEMLPDFLPLNGIWTFTGDLKPEFLWQETLWVFAGENIALRYSNPEDQSEDFKFYFKDGIIHIRKNSMLSLNREKMIGETFEIKAKEPGKESEAGKDGDTGDDARSRASAKLQNPRSRVRVLPRDEALFKMIEAMVADNERVKFRQMCASPELRFVLTQGQDSLLGEFFDIDSDSLTLRTGNDPKLYAGLSEIHVLAKYQNFELDLKVKGDLELLSQTGSYTIYKLSVTEAERKLLPKLSALFKVRKKLIQLFIKTGRV